MYKEHFKVKTAYNAGRVIGHVGRKKGTGKSLLFVFLGFAGMILFVFICKKLGIM